MHDYPPLIIVDFDDTLVSIRPSWIDVYVDSLRGLMIHQGRDAIAESEEFRKYLNRNRGATLGVFARRCALIVDLDPSSCEEVLQTDLEKAYTQAHYRVSGRVRRIIEMAGQYGAAVVILTGGLASHKRAILSGLGLADLARLVTGYGDQEFDGKGKWLAKQRMLAPGRRMLMIGDGDVDRALAKSVEAYFVGVGGIRCDCPIESFGLGTWLQDE